MGATPTTLTREDLKAAVDDLVDEIVNGSDQSWQDYAARLAGERTLGAKLGMFKPWSMNNTFLLHAQVNRRKANVKGLYAGVDQWRRRNRTPRDGEKPYIIYGPSSYFARAATPAQAAGTPAAQGTPAQSANPAQSTTTKSGTATKQAPPATAAPPQRVRMFRRPPTIEVYDWTQTESNDPDYLEPDWEVPLAFGDLDTLHQLVETAPVPVTFTDLAARNERSWLTKDGITVDSSSPVGNRIFTLIDQLAHYHLGHLDEIDSTLAPTGTEELAAFATYAQEAALAQYLTMKMLGLDESAGNNVTQAAGAHLRSWMRTDSEGNTVAVEGHKTKRKLVLKRFDAAFKAADAIVSAYLALSTDRELAAAS